MSKTYFKFVFLLLSNVSFIYCEIESQVQYNPLLVVILMVKDEESVINQTLEPFIREKIDSFLILDTGSTDKTIETVRNYFKTNNIENAYIFEEPFVDFSTSRNRAIELAKEKFPKSAFLFMIDAEWYVKNISGLINFCKNNINNSCPVYLLRGVAGPEDFYSARLMKTNSNAHFKGVAHEVLMPPPYSKLPADVYFDYSPSNKGQEKSAKRWAREVKLFLNDHQKNPNDTRTTFYLAQTYECLGDLHNAYKYYEIRSKQNGFDEEDYESLFRLARVTNSLSKIDKNYSWDQAHQYYLKAYSLRPHRAEALIKIAEHYWPSDIPLCFLYAKRAYDLPYPERDTLFVDRNIYEYEKYDMISKSAWHVGEYELGEQATLQAIKYRIPHLYNNLMCYFAAKKIKAQNKELAK